jgi:hypothetical protein
VGFDREPANVGATSKEKGYLERALDLALSLKNSGKLKPEQERMLDDLRSLIAQ